MEQTIAHEIVHCQQHELYGTLDRDRWWQEATAEYFSNVVYPLANGEWRLSRYDPERPLYDFESGVYEGYGRSVFFQSLANFHGGANSAVYDLMNALAGAGGRDEHPQALHDFPRIGEIFSHFARALHTGRVADTAPGYFWPVFLSPVTELYEVRPPGLPDSTQDGVELQPTPWIYSSVVEPFESSALAIRFHASASYSVRVAQRDAGIDYAGALLPDIETAARIEGREVPQTPLAWDALDSPILSGCGTGNYVRILLVVSNTSTTDGTLALEFREDPSVTCP